MVPKPEFLTAKEVAAMLGLRRTAFYKWLQSHPTFPAQVPFSKSETGGDIMRYPAKKVRAWIDMMPEWLAVESGSVRKRSKVSPKPSGSCNEPKPG